MKNYGECSRSMQQEGLGRQLARGGYFEDFKGREWGWGGRLEGRGRRKGGWKEMEKREGGRPVVGWKRSRRAGARGWGGEGAGSPGPAPGRPERPAVPLTSGSRKPQSRAVAAVGSGRCGPIGLLGAQRRGASRRAQVPGPAAALPPWRVGRARTARGGAGRRCCWGRRCSADFLFRLRPEDAETPARGTWRPGRRAWPVGRVLGAVRSRRWQAAGCGSGCALLFPAA